MTKNETTRETVNVGLDFRPLPIDVGDGTAWLFNPDPSPTDWGVLTDAMSAFAALAKQDTDDPNLSELPDLIQGLTDALAGLLVDPDQREQFVGKRYGVMAQQRLAVTLIESLSGFPTQSP